jgi:1-acyl-sn-glycerol-3-phosphate acyltransferase
MNDTPEAKPANAPLKKTWFQDFGYHFVRILTLIMFKILFRIRIENLENIPQTGPVLICPNHQSHFDPMLIGCCSKRRMNFVAKKQLFKVWFIGWMIRFLDSIPLDREGMSAGGLKATLKCLKRGEMVLMFPEGTRTPDGEMKKVLPGFCALVKRTDACLLPVGIQGAWDVWPRNRSYPLPGPKIVIVFGKPISAARIRELDDEQLVETLDREIRECVELSKKIRSGKSRRIATAE